MGNNHDPITLHKYLYANADPANMIDPSGNISIGSIGVSLNIRGVLATGARAASNGISRVFIGSGGSTSAAGGSALANQLGKKYFRSILRKCKKGKSRICQFAKGFLQAHAKVEAMVRITPNSRLQRGVINRVVVVIGAFDVRKGVGAAAFNGSHKGASARLRAHARKFGLGIGERNACGTKNTVGRCAEWRSADKLLRKGAKISDLRWIAPRYVNPGPGGFARIGPELKPCNICSTVFN